MKFSNAPSPTDVLWNNLHLKPDDYLKTIYKSLEQSISIIQIIVSNPSEYTDKVIKSANNVLKMV